MHITIRRATIDDAAVCGHILYAAFKNLADQHGFPPDFHTEEDAIAILEGFIPHPAIFGVVAECEGEIVGSNFLDERDEIRSVGPISVDPRLQQRGVGRRLMETVLQRAAGKNVRLLTDGFNTTSIPLYTTLGFEMREPVLLLSGRPGPASQTDLEVRAMTEQDVAACAALGQRMQGYQRLHALQDMHKDPLCAPFVALRAGKVVAYLTAATFWPFNHGVAETDEDMQALLLGAAAASEEPLALLVPCRQTRFFRWCLAQGLQVVKPIVLMTIGAYQEPKGCYFPSIEY
jgi:predicted N-acetyltransferase YhbS